ncbi:hypothetical protein E5S67_02620 [Microcoleus sp. IPMA8]|uniref:Uncharacterized protein n=1 Tax=Microcoleus asticus IPMA8 TaxID=2563858 RepID=A0ABX2CX45_9CYAN|nr:hypothetical protein [Microcoleus asticus IPMA8]
MIIVGKEISLRSQIPHILNTESRCLTDSYIIQAIEQLRRDRLDDAIARPYDIPYVETIW